MVARGYGCVVSACLLFWCASHAGAASGTKNENLMLADFEGGKAETNAGLSLVIVADEQLGGNSEVRLTPGQPGAAASRTALRMSFVVADGFATPFASVWAPLGAEGLAEDLSAYKGVRFYARSEKGVFLAGIGKYTSGRSTRATAPFAVTPAWTLVEIPFDKFKAVPPPPPDPSAIFEAKGVISVGFSMGSPARGQFDLEIDQLEIYK